MAEKRIVKVLQMGAFADVGGMEEYIFMLSRALNKYDVEVIVTSYENSGPLIDKLNREGIRTVFLPVGSPFDIGALIKIIRLILREKVDVVHSRLRNLNLHTAIAMLLFPRKAYLITLHVAFNRDVEGNRQTGLGMQIKDRILSMLLNTRADRIIAISEWIKNDAVRFGKIDPEKVTVIYNAIEETKLDVKRPEKDVRAELGVPAGNIVVGCISRFTREKGYDTVLRAFEMLASEYPDLTFIYVGNSWGMHEEKERIEKKGLSHRIILTGRRLDAMDILNTFDIFVLGSKCEGFGRVLVEAMALSKPVVATRVGGIPEVVQDGKTGILVPHGAPAALAEAVTGLIHDPAKMREFGIAGRKVYEENFRERTFLRDTLALYRRILLSKFGEELI